MNESWLPTAEEFDGIWAHRRPVAAIRLRCKYQHDMTEWWLDADGGKYPWGRHADERPQVVSSEGIGGFVFDGRDWRQGPHHPSKPEGGIVWRYHLRCPRPTCDQKITLRTDNLDKLENLLEQMAEHGAAVAHLLAGHLESAEVIEDHPAGAVTLALNLHLFNRASAEGF